LKEFSLYESLEGAANMKQQSSLLPQGRRHGLGSSLHYQHNSLVDFTFTPENSSSNSSTLSRLNGLFERIADRRTMGIRADKLFRIINKADCNKHTIEKYRHVLGIDNDTSDSTCMKESSDCVRVVSRGPFLAMFKYEDMKFVNSLESSARTIRMKREKKRQNKLLKSSEKKKNISCVTSVRTAPIHISSQQAHSQPNSKNDSSTSSTTQKSGDKLKPGMMLIVPEMEDEMSAVTISPVNSADLSKDNNKQTDGKDASNNKDLLHSLPVKIKTPLKDVSNTSRRMKKMGSVTKSRRKKSRSERDLLSDDDSVSNERVSITSSRKSRRSSRKSVRKSRRKSGSPSFSQDSDADDELCSLSDLPARSLFVDDQNDTSSQGRNENQEQEYPSNQGQRYIPAPQKVSSAHHFPNLQPQYGRHMSTQRAIGQIQQKDMHQRLYQMRSPQVIAYPSYNVYHHSLGQGIHIMPSRKYHNDSDCESGNCQIFGSVAKFFTDLFSDPRDKMFVPIDISEERMGRFNQMNVSISSSLANQNPPTHHNLKHRNSYIKDRKIPRDCAMHRVQKNQNYYHYR